jgi:hypothetical protein
MGSNKAEQEEGGDESDERSQEQHKENKGSTLGTIDEENADNYEIEVSTDNFYENMAPELEFIASLHTFPMKELPNVSGPSTSKLVTTHGKNL